MTCQIHPTQKCDCEAAEFIPVNRRLYEDLVNALDSLLRWRGGETDDLDFDAQGMEEDLRWENARRVLERTEQRTEQRTGKQTEKQIDQKGGN